MREVSERKEGLTCQIDADNSYSEDCSLVQGISDLLMQWRVQKRLGFNFPASVVVIISTSTQQFQNSSICKTSRVKQSRIKSDSS